MPLCVGKCPVPWPNIMNNRSCMIQPEIPEDLVRLRCDPFVRLVCFPTKSSLAKKCDNPCAPKDHLDIALSACYDHHRQWWAPPVQTVMQCETYRLFPWGRAQRRVCRLKCMPDAPCCDPCIASIQDQHMVNHEPYRNDVNHRNDLDSSIPSPHISNTNRGFARAVDGLFYNS